MQQYAGIYLLQNYYIYIYIYFGCLTHPSSGVQQTELQFLVQVISRVRATTFRQRGLIMPRWRKVVALTRDMTSTKRCS